MALRGETDGVDEVLCVCGAAVLGFDVPFVCLQVELSADNSRVESGVFLDLEFLFDVGEVATEFLPVGVFLRPGPVLIVQSASELRTGSERFMWIAYLPDLLDRIFVDGHLGINACTWVAVPMPDSTKVLSSLVDLAVKT